MSYLIWVLGTVIIIMGVWVWYLVSKKKPAEVESDDKEGICSFSNEQAQEKEQNKKKIMELFREKGQLNNTDVRDAFSVSARTAVNYMDELERENKVKQVGKTGQNVIYRLK